MADIRINALTSTAATTASDDYLAVDGSANGTRKLSAFSPTFGGNLTASGAATIGAGLTSNGDPGLQVNATSSIGRVIFSRTAGTLQSWQVGTTGNDATAIAFNIDDNTVGATRFKIAATTGLVTIGQNLTVSGGTITGGTSGLSLASGGTNQNISITPSGTGRVHIAKSAGQDSYIELAGNGNTAGTSSVVIGQSGADLGVIYNRKNADLAFGTNGTEVGRFKAGGNYLIGTTTDVAAYKLNVYGATSANVIAANGVTPDGTKTGGVFATALGGTGGATGSYALAGDIAGRFVMNAYGNNFIYEAASMQAEITTGGNTDRNLHVAALDFYTKPTASNTLTRKMRLTGTGNLILSSTGTDGGQKLQVDGTALINNGASGSATAVNAVLRIENASNAVIQLNVPDASAGGIYFGRSTDAYYSGLERSATNTLIRSGGATALTLDSSQNATFANYVTVDTTSGAAYRVKKSNNASGSQSWLSYLDASGTWAFQCANDNFVGGNTAFTFTRSGLTPTGMTINATTASTSTTTGALVVTGGVGVGGNITANNIIAAKPAGGWAQLEAQAPAANTSAAVDFVPAGTVSYSNPTWFVGHRFSAQGPLSFWAYNGSGHENNALSLTTAGNATLAGNLTVSGTQNVFGLPASASVLSTNSTMTFELTSNTSLTIKVRGTDGITRSASLTLA